MADQILLAAGVPAHSPGKSKIIRSVKQADVDRQSPQYAQLSALIRRALIAENRHKELVLIGGAPDSGDPIFRASGATRPDTPGARSLDELIAAFASDPSRGSRSDKTNTDYGMVFAALRDIIGSDRPVDLIKRDHLRRVRELFRALPPNATKRFRGKTLVEASEIATEAKLPVLNAQTVNSHLTKVATLFN